MLRKPTFREAAGKMLCNSCNKQYSKNSKRPMRTHTCYQPYYAGFTQIREEGKVVHFKCNDCWFKAPINSNVFNNVTRHRKHCPNRSGCISSPNDAITTPPSTPRLQLHRDNSGGQTASSEDQDFSNTTEPPAQDDTHEIYVRSQDPVDIAKELAVQIPRSKCIICYEKFTLENWVTLLPCRHAVCRNCDHTMDVVAGCPVCRGIIDPKKDFYVPERILARDISPTRGLVYQVKWEGYSEDESTWEPVKNVCHLDLFQKAEANLQKKINPTQETLSLDDLQPL